MIDCHDGSINSIQKRFNQCFGIPFNEIQFEEWRKAQMSVIALTPSLGGKNFYIHVCNPSNWHKFHHFPFNSEYPIHALYHIGIV